MGNLSPHFDSREFACNDAAQTPVPPEYMDNVRLLAQQLEVVRQKIGMAIVVSSGYRTPEHNVAINGAVGSQHLTAKGVDVYALMGMAELYCVFEQLIAAGRIRNGGLGAYADGHVHYDTGAVRRWNIGVPVPVCPPPQQEEGMSSREYQEAMAANANTNKYLGAVGELAAANKELAEFNEAKIVYLADAMQSVHGGGHPPEVLDQITALAEGQAKLKARVAAAEAAMLAAAKALAGG